MLIQVDIQYDEDCQIVSLEDLKDKEVDSIKSSEDGGKKIRENGREEDNTRRTKEDHAKNTEEDHITNVNGDIETRTKTGIWSTILLGPMSVVKYISDLHVDSLSQAKNKDMLVSPRPTRSNKFSP